MGSLAGGGHHRRRKQRFKEIERSAFMAAHANKCAYCREFLLFRDLHLDHVIPEWMADSTDELATFLISCSIRSDFPIRDRLNILPCHTWCNLRKGGIPFPPERTNFFLEIAERAANKFDREKIRISNEIEADAIEQRKRLIKEAFTQAPTQQTFDISSLALQKRRNWPAQLRSAALENYGGRCCFTGAGMSSMLEIAHIRSIGDGGRSILENVLILTPNMHWLFDRGLITVTEGAHILVSSQLRNDGALSALNGKGFASAHPPLFPPDEQALSWHRNAVFIS